MTVKSLEVAKEIVGEDPEGVIAVYEYNHAITGEELWSVEHWVNRGATEASGYVCNPRLVYTKEGGWMV
jgi:hypothetical protein